MRSEKQFHFYGQAAFAEAAINSESLGQFDHLALHPVAMFSLLSVLTALALASSTLGHFTLDQVVFLNILSSTSYPMLTYFVKADHSRF